MYDFPSILERTVLRTLQHLPANKSTAYPLLTNLVLKQCAPFFTPSVSYMFNLSVTTGVFPAAWKQATVIPLYKNRGKAEDPSNYRPVSLLPALRKALDKIESQRLLKHLVEQQLISLHRFGFIPGKSATLQLFYLTEKWYRALERGKNVTAVFLDYKKAFVRVWHHGLLPQLTYRSWHIATEPHVVNQLPVGPEHHCAGRIHLLRTQCHLFRFTTGLTPWPGPVHYFHQQPDTHCIYVSQQTFTRMTPPCIMSTFLERPLGHLTRNFKKPSTAQKTRPNHGTESSGMPKPGLCQQAKASTFKHLHPQSTDSR